MKDRELKKEYYINSFKKTKILRLIKGRGKWQIVFFGLIQ